MVPTMTHISRRSEVAPNSYRTLKISGSLYTFANRFARFAQQVTAQLFMVHCWGFDMNINSVK